MKAVFSVMNGEPGRSAWMPLALALLVLVCFSSAPALGQDYWQGTYNSNWFNAGNWSLGGLPVAPNAGTSAVINSTAFNPVVIDAPHYSGITASVANLTLQNAANGLTVLSGDTLYVYGSSIANAGTISITGGGYGSSYLNLNANTTLSGGGTVTLGGDGYNYIQQNAGGGLTLTNVNNTIQGYGWIGSGGLALNNQGTINANVLSATTVQSLFLAGGGAITNTGLLEATSGGTLAIYNNVANVGGNITANGAGSSVLVYGGATITGGTLNSLNGGPLGVGGPFGGNSATLDGLTAGPINLHTDGLGGNTWNIGSGNATYMQGTINNNGNIQLSGGGTGGAYLGFNANTTLQGGGTVTMGGNGYNYLFENAGNVTLTNADHTIQGYGAIGQSGYGYNGLSVINQATIDANVSGGTLSLNSLGAFTNSSLLEATNGGTLAIYNNIANTGANITANGAGSSVLLYNAVITGGTLNSLNGGTFTASGSPVLDGLTAGPLTLYTNVPGGNTWNIGSGNATYMQGTINNNGNIQLSGGGYGGAYLGFNANTTLQGGGTVTMGGNGYNYIFENAGNVTLTNVDHTIQGYGVIGQSGYGYNGLSEVNGAAGTILANTPGRNLYIDGSGTLTNNGTLQANAGSALVVTQNLANFSGNTLTGGTYFANNGTLQFNLGSNTGGEIVNNAANIHLFGADSNFFDEYAHNALSNLSTNASTGSFTVDGGAAFDANAGGFTNAGAVLVGTGSSFSTDGEYDQTGGTTQDDGTLTASLVDIIGGTLSGTGRVNGNVNIGLGGKLSPGDSPGTLTIVGNYTQSGTLFEQVGGTPGSGLFDVTNIDLSAAIGGTLDIDLVNGFAPGVNTHYVYNILEANGGVYGTFATLDFLNLPSGDTYSVDYSNPNYVILDLNGKPQGGGAVPEPSFFLPLAGLFAVAGFKFRGRRGNAVA